MPSATPPQKSIATARFGRDPWAMPRFSPAQLTTRRSKRKGLLLLGISNSFSHFSCEGEGFPKGPIPSSSGPNVSRWKGTWLRFMARWEVRTQLFHLSVKCWNPFHVIPSQDIKFKRQILPGKTTHWFKFSQFLFLNSSLQADLIRDRRGSREETQGQVLREEDWFSASFLKRLPGRPPSFCQDLL